MASFLHACMNGCGRVLRSMTRNPKPTICDPCKKAIKANEAEVKRERERLGRLATEREEAERWKEAERWEKAERPERRA